MLQRQANHISTCGDIGETTRPKAGKFAAGRMQGAQISQLISYSHDADLYAAWARLMVFSRFEPLARCYASGCAFLRGQGKGRIRSVRGLKKVLADLGPRVMEKKLPMLGTLSAEEQDLALGSRQGLRERHADGLATVV